MSSPRSDSGLCRIFLWIISVHQSLLPGKNCRLCAIKHMQLAENVAYMDFHCFFADHQFFRVQQVAAQKNGNALLR